jgi:chromosome segregation ATPase
MYIINNYLVDNTKKTHHSSHPSFNLGTNITTNFDYLSMPNFNNPKNNNEDYIASPTLNQTNYIPNNNYLLGDSDEIINHTRNVLNRSKMGHEENKSLIISDHNISSYEPTIYKNDNTKEYKERIDFLENELKRKDQNIYKNDNTIEYLERIAFLENELKKKDQNSYLRNDNTKEYLERITFLENELKLKDQKLYLNNDNTKEYLERITFLENELKLKDRKTSELIEEIQALDLENNKLDQRLRCEIEKNDRLVEEKHNTISQSNKDLTNTREKYDQLEKEFHYLEYQFKRSEEIRQEQSMLIKKLQKELDIMRSSVELNGEEKIKTAEFSDGEETTRPKKKKLSKSVDKTNKKITTKKKVKTIGPTSPGTSTSKNKKVTFSTLKTIKK